MPLKLIILGHRGEGCTNRDPAAYKRTLTARNDPFYENQILPENSLSAFASALRHGADGIECDVYISKDGIPMVAHDDELARNVDGYHYWGNEQNDTILGRISGFTASELQAKFFIGNNERIPTLDDLIQLMLEHNISYRKKFGRNLTINIELKGGAPIADATYRIIKKYIDDSSCPFQAEDFLFNSFEADCLVAMKKIDSAMRCALGIPSKELYHCEIMLPGWVPVSTIYSERAKANLNTQPDQMQLSGLDVVTSDVQEYLAALCAEKGMFLNAATNALRLRIQAEKEKAPEAKLTDLEREQIEFTKLAKLSKKFNILIYYKADNPGVMKTYLKKLEAIDVAAEENVKAKQYLENNYSKYDPKLFKSLQDSLRQYQNSLHNSGAHNNELGIALAESLDNALEETVLRMGNQNTVGG
jgi:glycerophosphoryl diester phosphodiesterase